MGELEPHCRHHASFRSARELILLTAAHAWKLDPKTKTFSDILPHNEDVTAESTFTASGL